MKTIDFASLIRVKRSEIGIISCCTLSIGKVIIAIFEAMKIGFAIFCSFFTLLVDAQSDLVNMDTLLLTNGKKIGCTILQTDDLITEYEFTKSNGKIKNNYAGNSSVFSLDFFEKEDTVLYQKDTLFGNDLSIVEMRKYVYGEIDARKNYKTFWYFAGGSLLGFSSVFLDTYLYPKETQQNSLSPGAFKAQPSVFPIFVPFAYTLSISLPKTRLKAKHVDHQRIKRNKYYQSGFEKIARQKRIFSGLESTVAGMALGYICYFIFRK